MSKFPGIGAIVHYFAPGNPDRPLAAIVAGGANSGDECRLNLTAFPEGAPPLVLLNVHHVENWLSPHDATRRSLAADIAMHGRQHEDLKLSGKASLEEISLSESTGIGLQRKLEEFDQQPSKPHADAIGWWRERG